MDTSLPHFEIEIVTLKNGNPGAEVFDMIKKLRPKWDKKDMRFKVLSGGYINHILKCWNDSDANETALTIRIYNPAGDIIDKKTSLAALKALHHQQKGLSLVATFSNGVIYDFIKGREMSAEEAGRPEIRRSIAREIAVIHSTPASVSDKFGVPREPTVFNAIIHQIERLPDDLNDLTRYEEPIIRPKAKLMEEHDFLLALVKDEDSTLVLSHGDLWCANILYDSDTGNISFCDYDFLGMNYQLFDLAYFILHGQMEIRAPTYIADPLPIDLQEEFIETYLRELKSLKGECTEVSPSEVSKLVRGCKVFFLVNMLFNITFLLALAAGKPDDDFDFIWLANEKVKKYFKMKSDIIAGH